MISILNKIKVATRNNTTYRVGLLQTKAYRILKQHTTDAIAPFDITTVHWAFLGMLYDQQKGIRLAEAAKELGVEASFVTVMFNELKKKEFVLSETDPTDSRAKIICLSKEGKKFVTTTEAYLRKEIKSLTEGASIKDILAYLTVLETIVKNNQ